MDSEEPQPEQEQEQMAPEQEQHEDGGGTPILIGKESLPPDCKPGTRIMLEVEKVHDDQAECRLVDEGGHEQQPEQKEEPQSAMAAMME